MDKRNCKKCGAAFTAKRNPKQSYCSKLFCQKARKNLWRERKAAEDLDYLENHKISNKKWRMKKTSYWRDYRKNHPEYTERNRSQCRERKKKRLGSQTKIVPQFAKSDALLDKNILESGTYSVVPIDPQFAKSDALTVKISLIT